MADPAILPAACNQLDTIRSSVNRNTSQLMVHLEPVILRTPFGPMGSTREGKEKGKRRGREKERERGEEEEKEKKRRRRGNRVEAYLCRCFKGVARYAVAGCRQRSSGGFEVRSSHTWRLPRALEAHGSDACARLER